MRVITSFIPLSLAFLTLVFSTCSDKDSDPMKEEPGPDDGKKILMFVAKENTYYSEYVVMREALVASGYEVDVRSSATGTASLYMIPNGTTIAETSNSLPGSNHSQFTSQFKDHFGTDWNEVLNTIPPSIALDGKIQDVENMDAYQALVIVGGTGALAYRVDGSYEAQGLASGADVQASAEKLNALALEALQSGKPVMAQCHGASLPVYWKLNNSQASLLAGQYATGFPEETTAADFAVNEVNYRPLDKVVVSSPAEGLNDSGNGDSKIITTRDWYPQTVAHAARTLLNILETYPTQEQRTSQIKVLILHGGSIDPSNCNAGNRDNDVPCNYGAGAELPADFTHIKMLLTTSGSDQYAFVVEDLDITSTPLPYAANQSAIEPYLNGFDVVIFFKHWSTGVTPALQKALVAYAENGGGVLGLHHALYNDIDDADPSLNKNILVNELFGAQSAEAGWGADRTTYNLYATNYGHFISTFRVPLNSNPAAETPGAWFSIPPGSGANRSFSVYKNFTLFDEIYTNNMIVPGHKFGRGENEITPLFSNDLGGNQMHTEGFAKIFNVNGDDLAGKVAFFQPGETRENFSIEHPYAQVVRNAVVWLAN